LGARVEHTENELKRARRALTIVFLANGALVGAFTARVADIKHHLHLTDGSFGTALLLCSIASFASMAPTSRLVSRLGSAPSTLLGVITYCAVFPVLGLVSSAHALWVALILFGVAMTILEVAMNSHAVALEHLYGRRIMTVMHATWSFGGLVAVGIGGVLSQVHVSVFANFLGASAIVLVAVGATRSWLLPAAVDRRAVASSADRTKRSLSWRHLPIFFIALGLLGLCEQIAEGAAGTWGAILSRDSYHASPLLSTMPYVVFSVVMVVCRLFGDRLAMKFSTRAILSASGVIIAVGLGIGMALNSIAGVLFAWAFLGAGSANVVPLLFSAAGRAARTRASSSISPAGALALVTAVAYSGGLIGPPSIGYLADASSLRLALLLPAALGAVFAVGVFAVLSHDDDVAASPEATAD